MKRIILLFVTGLALIGYTSGQLALSFTVSNPSCFGYYDGAIDLNISGGITPYSVTWYSQGVLIAASEDVSGISQGDYVVQVIDSVGLTTIDTVWLFPPYEITTIDTISDAGCYSANGSINITPEGGTGFYMGILNPMKWDAFIQEWFIDSTLIDTTYTNIDTVSFKWSVPAGYYYILVAEDSGSGCFIEKYVEINQPSAPLTFNKTFGNVTCKDGNNGFITIIPDGGTPPYLFSWSSGQNTSAISSLTAGLYNVVVYDNRGCSKVETIEIEEPFQDLIIVDMVSDVSCRDNHDGAISISEVENSVSPLSYSWSTGASLSEISNLDAAFYTLTVTDGNNCQVSKIYDVALKDVDCIVIYNVLTPDGNGKNDLWEIKNIELYPECTISVLNRWGKEIFSAGPGYDNSWDGKSDGKLLESGDYYYIVNLNFGNYPPYTGPVKILK